ncbi:FecCD family ABC transporter permease [Sinorhizobium medicae]|uniref:FecCD family ABC transporter permease n=1 Tax=Sinorhizobium medicae TaxID=110321 RepID=UPI000FD96E71|nr:iron ABC transporter permease [Sinorhizobium medicae]RVP52904.1 iron ABC transporter permease [Sinorhizobium medicae]RVP72460.1 iron ABC transporter permease [Sinorhizobium medicae]UWU07163.1 iron ABC transporter permease [Sinorhizobium medicae]
MVVIESARRNTPATRIFAFGLFALLLALLSLWSLTIGTTAIPLGDALRAIISEGTSHQDVVISTIRLPRVLTAIIVGSTLGVAGALMQAVTNNPLASPDLLGISAGAAFAVVISIVFFDAQSPLVFLWFAFGGAAVAGILVYMVASTGVSGVTPVKLALSGAVLSVFLGSVSASLLIFDMKAIDIIRLWSVGSLTGKDMAAVAAVAPFALAGVAATLLLARQVSTLSLGADVAQAVGQNVLLWRLVSGALMVLMAGSSVALAGPIGFVGLVVPHIVRLSLGTDYRWILPFCAISGALLVVMADGLQRSLTGIDVPVGVTLALVGAPFFIWLARLRAGGIG